VGLFYTDLVQGIPPVFPHLIEKIPSIHAVLLFVSVKHLPVPHVDMSERFLFRQVEPREHKLYRCVARYGYRDPLKEAKDFVASLVERLQYYIRDVNLYGVEVDAKAGKVSYPSSRCDSMARSSTRAGATAMMQMYSASCKESLALGRARSSSATGRMMQMGMMNPSASYTERLQDGRCRSIYAEEMMTPAESFSELAYYPSGRYGASSQQLFQAAKMSLEEMAKIEEEQRYIEREMEKGPRGWCTSWGRTRWWRARTPRCSRSSSSTTPTRSSRRTASRGIRCSPSQGATCSRSGCPTRSSELATAYL
jgi:KUP system potassium uptake protein